MTCDKCKDTGYFIKTITLNEYPYEFVYHCDCWTGISRNEAYPSIKPTAFVVEQDKLID